ncbi:unnamed protein product [Arabidopsis thaliana]|uniref:(thale cress) hypothetical protein n=1 Tax=Arabidopsis thaliana TaxID=3702 RepID=A0A7G2E0R8_ARATH|nr:unnamed protein product [Arabidopsis thaliana]
MTLAACMQEADQLQHWREKCWRPFFRVDEEILNIHNEQLGINEDHLHGAQSIHVASNIRARKVFEFPYLQTSMKPEDAGGESILSKFNIMFYSYKDAAYPFRMVPPIVYAHLAILRVNAGDLTSSDTWRLYM